MSDEKKINLQEIYETEIRFALNFLVEHRERMAKVEPDPTKYQLTVSMMDEDEIELVAQWGKDVNGLAFPSKVYEECARHKTNFRNVAYIAIFDIRQQFGGPEEGGWYYDDFALLDYEPIIVTYDKDGKGSIQDEEAIIRSLSYKWADEYGDALNSGKSTSCAARAGSDLVLKASWEEPESHNDYQPWC